MASFNLGSKVICFQPTRGQVGNSSIVYNIAKLFSAKGKSVLLVDCNLNDPQLWYYCGLDSNNMKINLVSAVRSGSINSAKAFYATNDKYIKLLSNSPGLPYTNYEMMDVSMVQNLLSMLRSNFDIVLIDCTPELLHEFTFASLLVASSLVFTIGNNPDDILVLAKMMKFFEVEEINAHIIGAIQNNVSYRFFSPEPFQALGLPYLGGIPYSARVNQLICGSTPKCIVEAGAFGEKTAKLVIQRLHQLFDALN